MVVPDFPHHVVQRGVRRMDVFFSDGDRVEYLSLLSQSASKHSSNFLAWCLMSNHAHFVVMPRQSKSLSATFGEAHRRYTRMVNFREGWRGHLWQERFHSYPMDEHHLLAAVRYVEMNPVRAGLVQKPEDWEWSSADRSLRIVSSSSPPFELWGWLIANLSASRRSLLDDYQIFCCSLQNG